jgi:DNA-binding beta-propeller fold protein YncE
MRARIVLTLLMAAAAAGAPHVTLDHLRDIDSIKEFTKPGFLGKLLNFVAGPPEDQPRLVRPFGLVEDSTGRLLIADPGQRAVHLFDFEKHKYQCLKSPRKQSFRSPIAVAVDRTDNIYVADSESALIHVFNAKGKWQRALGGVFRRPTGLAIDDQGQRIYVTDTLRHQVLVLNFGGELLRAIGGRGRGPGEFNFPTAVTLAGGNLYVVDAMNFRIQTLTPDGDFVSSFGRLGDRSGMLNRPKGIGADSAGNLYVVDALFGIVQVFDRQGRLLYYFGSEFELPAGIYIDPRDRIYVADSYNRRVQVFRLKREGM